MRILALEPRTHIYHEYASTAFSNYRVRSAGSLRLLVRVDPAYNIVFKPICDTQYADRVMADWPDATAIWPYRHYSDVANSAVVKWQDHQRQVVQALLDGRSDWDWRTEHPIEHVLAQVRAVWSDDVSPHEGAVLFWYIRNQYFWELGLDRDPRFLMVRYEHLVSQPQMVFRTVFEHVGSDFDPDFVARMNARSVGKSPAPVLRSGIRELADGLLERFDAEYVSRTGVDIGSLPAPK